MAAPLHSCCEEIIVHEEKLRDELLAWQVGQRELHRWKLVAIGGVAALGLGLTSQQGKPQILVVCLAPFIAAYCDALLRDYDLRIALIAFFLLGKTGSFSEYEQFIGAYPIGSSRWWLLSESASKVSSFGACALTVAAGVYGLWFGSFSRQAYFEFGAALASAAVGALLAIQIQRIFSSRYVQLSEAARATHAGKR
jgi:hypothetical protein